MVDLKEFEQKAADLRVLGMKISIGQDTVYEKYWDEDCRRNIYSASKSFTSCAVGFAVQEGLIDLDERLMDAFKEDIPNNPDENLKKATVKDLLTMTLGQEKGFLMGKQRPRMEEQNWVKASLAIPFVYEPGTHFVYNNVGPYLAGILVQRRAGCDLLSYLTPAFKTFGNTKSHMGGRPEEIHLVRADCSDCFELHKLGMFYLQNGCWNGKAVLNGSMRVPENRWK
ncbi:MAG: serine hydrolase domain-containing protein [Clostridium sp.]